MDFTGHPGWALGYIITLVVVLVVVALVVPILLLAHRIGSQARSINSGLESAVTNTAGLTNLKITIDSANAIVAGLNRGRHKLGG
jgi:preprotein translocase subunit SecG